MKRQINNSNSKTTITDRPDVFQGILNIFYIRCRNVHHLPDFIYKWWVNDQQSSVIRRVTTGVGVRQSVPWACTSVWQFAEIWQRKQWTTILTCFRLNLCLQLYSTITFTWFWCFHAHSLQQQQQQQSFAQKHINKPPKMSMTKHVQLFHQDNVFSFDLNTDFSLYLHCKTLVLLSWSMSYVFFLLYGVRSASGIFTSL